MAAYHVNTNPQPTGEHEVHKTGCSHQPDPPNRRSLGDHLTCHSAVQAARAYYSKVDGCYYCANECHTR